MPRPIPPWGTRGDSFAIAGGGGGVAAFIIGGGERGVGATGAVTRRTGSGFLDEGGTIGLTLLWGIVVNPVVLVGDALSRASRMMIPP